MFPSNTFSHGRFRLVLSEAAAPGSGVAARARRIPERADETVEAVTTRGERRPMHPHEELIETF